MSKVYWITLLSTMILQYGSYVLEYIPKLVALISPFVPPPFDQLVVGLVPLVVSWLITVLTVWARNQAVRKQTIASPVTGVKTEDPVGVPVPKEGGKGVW